MINFSRIPLVTGACHSVEKLRGTTDGNTPFCAYLLTVARKNSSLSFACCVERKTVSTFVRDAGASAGINGGFYVVRTGEPLDWLVIGGKTFKSRVSATRPCIFLRNGTANIGNPDEYSVFDSVMQSGPLLVRNSVIHEDFQEYRDHAFQFDADITAARYPRSAFGLNADSFFLLAVDGRSAESDGLYMRECGELALNLGMTDALNLDGGGSSALVVGNRLFNNPRASVTQIVPAERAIPTAILMTFGNAGGMA